MLELRTLNDVFLHVGGRGSSEVMLRPTGDDRWEAITSAQVYARVKALAGVLEEWGVGKGDRVAIVSENRWEWPVIDFAVLALGAVDVPLYPTLTPEQIGYMLRDSGAKVAFVSSREQHEKLAGAGALPELARVVVLDEGTFDCAENFRALLGDADERTKTDPAFEARLAQVQPDDLATIIYTSGTTGESKGVMLTHGNVASNLCVSTIGLGFAPDDSCISFLPLSHITARHVDYALMVYGAKLAYCARFEQLSKAMKSVRPTVFVGVPRVYEKIRQAVEGKSRASALRSRILRWALRTGSKHRAQVLAGRVPDGVGWKVANKLVYGKIREAFGGKVTTFISGGAPLGMDTAGWFADVGIRIFEGYGLTETSPVIALNTVEHHRIGSVGRALPNIQVRFAEDGELEVKGPSIFKGYWQKDNETAEAFTVDGWFRTGDIGRVDEDGFISITDRKKELLKTSGGKLIAPQPIENRLKANTLVAQAALVGDKHKFACVLISPNFADLEQWATGNGVANGDRGSLVREPRVQKLYQEIVDGVNAQLAHFETIKRFALVSEEWSVEGGQLTPSMKLKRRVVEQRYAAEITKFYADEADARA